MDRRFFLTFFLCSVLWIFFWEVRWKKGKESQIEEWLQGHRLSQYGHLFEGELLGNSIFDLQKKMLSTFSWSSWENKVYFPCYLDKDTSKRPTIFAMWPYGWCGLFFPTLFIFNTQYQWRVMDIELHWPWLLSRFWTYFMRFLQCAVI